MSAEEDIRLGVESATAFGEWNVVRYDLNGIVMQTLATEEEAKAWMNGYRFGLLEDRP